ncbi:ATP-dependent DNA helicase DDX11 isoform X2 [Diabrotica virgifera virgifera]|uniref:ATP-dependent DNA helicase DDX11 isoform X2 n=1 Tax=Diabrotica virgifera virgifera TaxID=50390 RepID=A0A6P7FTU6_DIAVI|nr:ATP-dependent DNA helicase DDX11 isoform X2 [Diabrotica virgifera virgifera]
MDNITETHLAIPETFDFPFPPYDIQLDFMKNLYYTLETGKFGIFESPTGTGKSLSIICGAIQWLKDRQSFEKDNLSESISKLLKEKENFSKNSTDWLSSQSKEIEINFKLNTLRQEQSKILEYNKKLEDIKKLKQFNNRRKFIAKNKSVDKSKIEKSIENENNESVDDEDILLEESLDVVEKNEEPFDEDEENEKYEPIKIYICSRTHSQLAQFVGEIIKSPFGSNVRVTSLASRQTYCINPEVSKLKSMALINERCLDLQKKTPKPKTDPDGRVTKRAKSATSCPYYKQTAVEELSNYALSEIQDVEDLVNAGKEFNACPYYASRKAAEDAEVVLIPYNTLLHKATREANGIKLKNNIVIVDEAHNLLEALAQMHNADLNYAQVYHALNHMKAYKNKFSTRFSAKNLLMINQLIFVITQLLQTLEKCNTENGTSISTIENFVLNANIDNYNMFKLTKFCKECRLAQKIRGYALKYPVQEQVKEKSGVDGVRDFLASIKSKTNTKKGPDKTKKPEVPQKPQVIIPPVSNPLLAVVSFLECLTYSYEDGRILQKKSKDKLECKFQFLLLNSSSHFSDIVKEARSVVVAGGTMKPISEFRDRLFINAGAKPEKIFEFSCDHIIPPENILPIIVTKGQKNENLLFNFENRMLMNNSVKNILLQACKLVKGGIVVFFPSYNYENWLWQQVEKLDFGRKVFREPQTSGQVDSVLEKYAETIKNPGSKGALLFSVVGGKLSEGLNFSDDLGRCVIVVGLPYANITAADLKEKMNYLDKTEGQGSGQKFYENQCMKAVNQCIGRAVRHRNDYATVLLLDERYSRASVKNALPNWIKRSLKVCNYDEAFTSIKKFFEDK